MPPPSDTIDIINFSELTKGLIEMFWAFSPLYPYFAGFLVLVALVEYFRPESRRRPRKRKPQTVIYIINQNNIDTKEQKK